MLQHATLLSWVEITRPVTEVDGSKNIVTLKYTINQWLQGAHNRICREENGQKMRADQAESNTTEESEAGM